MGSQSKPIDQEQEKEKEDQKYERLLQRLIKA